MCLGLSLRAVQGWNIATTAQRRLSRQSPFCTQRRSHTSQMHLQTGRSSSRRTGTGGLSRELLCWALFLQCAALAAHAPQSDDSLLNETTVASPLNEELAGMTRKAELAEANVRRLERDVAQLNQKLAGITRKAELAEANVRRLERDVAQSRNDRAQHLQQTLPDAKWLRNESCARQDLIDFYQEAVVTTHRFDSYGFNAWAWDEKPQALGVTAFVLCHVRERCASAELMLRAAGFDSIQFADTTRDGSEINVDALAALVSAGELSPHFSSSKVKSLEQKRKYVANALNHRDLLRAALSKSDTHPWIAIFEDDIILTTRPSLASSRIHQALLQLPEHADTLHLEYCNDECSQALYNKQCDSVVSAHGPYCSAGILYSQQGLKKVLDSLSSIVAPHNEHVADSCQQKRLNCFKLRQPVFAQDAFWDNISPEMVREPVKRHRLRLNGTSIIIMNTRERTQRISKYRYIEKERDRQLEQKSENE